MNNLLASAFFSLFLILGTFGNIFLFDAILSNYTNDLKEKRKAITKAYLIAYLIWLPIFLLGEYFLYIFGVSEQSFAIAGSIFLSLVSFEILSKDSPSYAKIGDEGKIENVIVSPMAVPLITGPGVITTTIIFRSMINDIISLFLVSSLAFFLSFLTVYILIGLLNRINRKYFIVLNRVFGLILLSIAVEILISAVKSIT